jgi:hypothetical protein
MRKPRISWDTEFECYCCMYEDDCFLGWPKVGTGPTVKEAFVDWYIKQIGVDTINDGVDNE